MKIFTILMLLFMPSLGYSDPLARFMPETVVGSVALKNKLVGTTWVYKWRGREYLFSFAADGSISKLKSWSMVTWVVTAPNEVVLEGISDRMVLLFNEQATGFTSIDWDGQKTSGKIAYK